MNIECKNLMEDIVLQNVDSVMTTSPYCTCDECKTDVIAYALNHLQPHYVATRQGRLIVELQSYEMQFRADVMTALSQAVEVVGKNPHHGRQFIR